MHSSHPLNLQQFDYPLPLELIAQTPIEPRDHSRLLYLERQTGAIAHHHFYELPQLLRPGDVLVRNNTKVMPARLVARKPSGGAVEVLLTHRERLEPDGESWRCLSKPGLKLGQALIFSDRLQAVCTQIDGFERIIKFNAMGSEFFDLLYSLGKTPLPPYIAWDQHDEAELRERYQTTYAKITGSVAAPTAGLHFTPELDRQLESAGIQIEELTLHVGLGTFLPVKTTHVADHHMHSETFEFSTTVADRLNQAHRENRQLIAVGTTTTRVLESCVDDDGILHPGSGETSIYIYPPYRFRAIQGMITNFHQPKSTLTMLVSAFVSAPNTPHEFVEFQQSPVGKAYLTAIAENYRFHSFGDAMLIK